MARIVSKSFAVALFCAVITSSATAAPISAYDWSGIYLGVNAGKQSSYIGLASDPVRNGPLTYRPHHESISIGFHAGLQKQFGQFVLGVEGGFTPAMGQQTFATPSASIFAPGGSGSTTVALRDMWNFGARAGYAFGNWLPYITAGVAGGRFRFDTVSAGALETARSTNQGGYFGGGVEYALAKNWIVGVEYKHYDFRSNAAPSRFNFPGSFPIYFSPTTDTFVLRANYKFDPLF